MRETHDDYLAQGGGSFPLALCLDGVGLLRSGRGVLGGGFDGGLRAAHGRDARSGCACGENGLRARREGARGKGGGDECWASHCGGGEDETGGGDWGAVREAKKRVEEVKRGSRECRGCSVIGAMQISWRWGVDKKRDDASENKMGALRSRINKWAEKQKAEKRCTDDAWAARCSGSAARCSGCAEMGAAYGSGFCSIQSNTPTSTILPL